jgi:DNA-binding transcriptional LysR family regulator
MTTSEQAEALHENRIHLGFIRLPLDDEELTMESVLQESFVAVLPESHPLATESQVSLRSLSSEPFIKSP